MTERRRNLVRWGALALGVALFAGTLYYVNFRIAIGAIERLGVALPLALVFSGLWHVVRTWAWAWCFPQPRGIPFARLLRVRLAAEAFSYLTLRGIAGEPLKVVLLADRVDARQATAAVALERLAYMIGTVAIVGVGSLVAIAGLPLSRAWFRVFRAFAIAAGVLTLLTGVVIAGRGTYLQSLLVRLDRTLGTSLGEGRVGRFVIAVERQMLDLVRGNPRRLVVLAGTTLLAYACMVLEAWVILRASGAPISPNGAVAVETFSRVASFASAFIPANLGALEASSLAAVAAVGAIGGGAALALARRLRGLFWAGVGLAIYPRGIRGARDRSAAPPVRRPTPPSVLLYFPCEPASTVSPATRLAGLPIAERVLRSALRAGHTHILVWSPHAGEPRDARLARLARSLGSRVIVARTPDQWRREIADFGSTAMTAIGGGTVVSPALLAEARDLTAVEGTPRDVAAGAAWPATGLLRIAPVDATDPAAVAAALAAARDRVHALPTGEDVSHGRARLAIQMRAPADVAAAERTIRRASYKDTDAKIARFNRRISLPISIALMPTRITANQLSIVLVAIGLYSGWLFSIGHYWTGVLGGFLSLAASVLDGCDGEIARLKYQESALGCWIETIGDYSYYLAVFVGLTVGAVRQTRWEAFHWIGGIAIAGTLLSFALLVYLRGRITAGQPERLHTVAKARFKAEPTLWSRIVWRISFVATRAAMPYGIMAFSLVYALPAIVVLAAIGANVYWISLVVKLRDLIGADQEKPIAA